MNMINEIITGKHIAERDGFKTHRERIRARYREMSRKHKIEIVYRDEIAEDKPVMARIDFGRWSARCDQCDGSEYVDPEEPVFYCFGCGNFVVDGKLRTVIFPPDEKRRKIEKLVLARPVHDALGLTKDSRALNAKPIVYQELEPGHYRPLSRSWEPDESIEDLIDQNKAIDIYLQGRGK